MYSLPALCIVAIQPSALSSPSTPAQPPASTRQTAPQNLAEALDGITWDPSARGVLLVVGAEQVRPQTALPPASNRAYNLKELVGYFERMAVPVGNLTVIAPTTMRVLIKPKQSPEEASWQSPEEALHALAASLSKNQWQILSSASGLGLSDLTEKQRPAFLASLPEPVAVHPVAARTSERTEQGIRFRSEPLPAGMSAVTLTPEQRSQVRIRVNRKLSFLYAPEGSESGGFSAQGSRARLDRTEAQYQLDPTRYNQQPQEGFQDLSNRPKPSDLEISSLRGVLTLTSATTVGELVKQAAQESKLELYVDPRVADLSVRCWGASARTSDVLSALCRAVTGTFRRVGPAYVLTHDREGLAALSEPQQLWQTALDQIKNARRKEQQKAVRQTNPKEVLAFAPGDPLQIPLDQLLRLEGDNKNGGGPVGVTVRDLPMALQQKVVEEVAQAQEAFASGSSNASANGQRITAFRSDKVWPRSGLTTSLILPGYGAFSWDNSGSFFLLQNMIFGNDSSGPSSAPVNTPLPALTWPQGERIALVQVSTPQESKALAQAAHTAGINTLWLKVPLSVKYVKPLLAAAQAEGIAVGLALSPFEAPVAALPTGATADLAATGVTSDVYAKRWLPFQDSEMLPIQGYHVDERILRGDDAILLALTELAHLPKLAGLLLTELVPPGYQKPSNGMFTFPMPRMGDFGYTLDNRVAFLRKTGCDPIDSVPPRNYNSMTGLPFFPPFGMSQPRFIRQADGKMTMQPPSPNVFVQWQEFRAEQAAAFLPRLQARLKQTVPDVSVYTMGRDPVPWIGSWDRPEPLSAFGAPSMGSFDTSNKVFLPKARTVSKRVLSLLPSFPQLTPGILRGGVSWVSKDFAGWDGVVLDFLNLPYSQVLTLINGLVESPK